MAMATATKTTATMVDRKELVKALKLIVAMLPKRAPKRVLSSVRLQTVDGMLELAATDLEKALTLMLPVGIDSDFLPGVLVDAAALLARVNGSSWPFCKLAVESTDEPGVNRLCVNGGPVTHSLPTNDLQELPPVLPMLEGSVLHLNGGEFAELVPTLVRGVARENTRYAINGVQLRSSGSVVNLAATDGRRLVRCRPALVQETAPSRSLILPESVCDMVRRLVKTFDEQDCGIGFSSTERTPLTEAGRWSQDGEFRGSCWRLRFSAIEGEFPQYEDVIPKSGILYRLPRRALASLVDEVSRACDENSKVCRLDLTATNCRVSAHSLEGGDSEGNIAVERIGDGPAVHTKGFNPAFMLDALGSLPGEHFEFMSHENPGFAAVFRAGGVEWVLMPVNLSAN